MSDTPLFQNTDEQESAYAPQSLPDGTEGDARADLEEGGSGREGDPGAGVILPAAALGGIGGGMGGNPGTAGSTGMGPAGAGPAIAGAALSGDLPAERAATNDESERATNDASGQTSAG
jgi:hypothetical protein